MYSDDQAELLAIRAVTWLLSEEDCLYPFLTQTGASADDIKDRINQPDFLGAALDFIMQSDEWVVACAEFIDIHPQDLQILRATLPGGQVMNWT